MLLSVESTIICWVMRMPASLHDARVVDERIEHRIHNRDHPRGGLVGVLILDEVGRLFVERHTAYILTLTLQLGDHHLLVGRLALVRRRLPTNGCDLLRVLIVDR